ncbi:hypothetical protein [Castellaniella sp.]|uniref:hypothetical protein n=1 Tax=Castellaniella sp. TaxID=1955812 RepID=UPI002AFE278A|nr:hypothetical protein [Castellaniella sp.]
MKEHDTELDEGILSHNAASALLAIVSMILLVTIMTAIQDLPLPAWLTYGGLALFIVIYGYGTWYKMSAPILRDGTQRGHSFRQFLASIWRLLPNDQSVR